MPAADKFHDAVKNALQKDGWTVTHEHYKLQFGGVRMYVDLAAERIMAAERNGQKIAVEVKSFIQTSTLTAFNDALGQYFGYNVALRATEPERELFLAVPSGTHQTFFALEYAQAVISEANIRVLVYDEFSEVILQWIN
jgi:uncharacterized protein YcbX